MLNTSPLSHRLRHCNNSSSNKDWQMASCFLPHQIPIAGLLVSYSLAQGPWQCHLCHNLLPTTKPLPQRLHLPSHQCLSLRTAGQCHFCNCWPINPTCLVSTALALEQQCITTIKGIIPTLQNIVTCVNSDCHLDLKTIVLHTHNAEYNPRLVSMTVLIFASGRVPSLKTIHNYHCINMCTSFRNLVSMQSFLSSKSKISLAVVMPSSQSS